jgi:hypothetical protein
LHKAHRRPHHHHQQTHRQTFQQHLHPNHLRRQSQLLRPEIWWVLRQLPRLPIADLHHSSMSHDDNRQGHHRQTFKQHLLSNHLRRQSQLLRPEIWRMLRQLPRLPAAYIYHSTMPLVDDQHGYDNGEAEGILRVRIATFATGKPTRSFVRRFEG